jgi:DNA-binding LacI/PurR family transcriptional regulator
VVSLRLSGPQLASFRHAGVPLVTIDAPASGVPQTLTDDVRGGRLATGHLLALGHRRIGFVGDTMRGAAGASRIGLGFITSQHRLRGYRQALAVAGIGYEARLVRRGPHGPANAEALAAELLARPDRPSAIFAASDTQAMGVLAAADRCGVSVPGELSVIGFDDIESAALFGLSTVRQPLADSGAEGARRLCALLRGERVSPLRQQLPLEVVRRSSTATFRAAGPGARPPAGAVTSTGAGAAAAPATRPSFALPGSPGARPSSAAAENRFHHAPVIGSNHASAGKLRWLEAGWKES